MRKHALDLTIALLRTLALGTGVSVLALVTLGAATAQNAGNTRMIERAAEAANGAEGKQTSSAKLARLLKDALEEMKADNYAAAIAKLEDAQGTAGKTPYDQRLINHMLSVSYVKTNNYDGAAKTMEAEVGDGMSSQAEIAQKVKALSEINYHLNNYDKAIEFGTRAIEGGFADERITTIVGQSYYLKGDYNGTRKFEDGLVEGQIKAGAIPSNESLMLIYSACQKTNDDACTEESLERLVAYYPKPETWARLLFKVRYGTSGNEANLLEAYRLMFDTDVLRDPGDYQEMAGLLLDTGSPDEAQRVLQRGMDRNLFNDPRTQQRGQRMLDVAKQRATSGRASLTQLAQEADAAPAGDKNAAAGRAFFGYSQFDKAADQFGRALLKGVTKGEAEDRLLLGIAQLKACRKDDAMKTFKQVKGDPALERLATLWQLHAKQA